MARNKKQRLAVVTGAEGFIGSNLVHELIAQKWEVLALHRSGERLYRLSDADIKTAGCDILIPQDLERAIPTGVDAIFHLAADPRITNKRLGAQSETNIQGTKNVLQCAMDKRCKRFLFTSSMGAFGIHGKRINENTKSNVMELSVNYFQTKYIGELEVDKHIAKGLDAVIVNPSNVVGPGDISNMPATLIRLIHNSALPFISAGSASFCHVREVARAMIACINHGRRGERYLLGGSDTTFMDLCLLIQDIVGGKAPRFVLPGPVFRCVARLICAYADIKGQHTFMTPEIALSISSDMLVDSSKAVTELGYQSTSLEEMFRDSAAWLSANDFLEIKSPWVWSKSPIKSEA